ncbi:MAG: 3-deoxy-D-manno-octulosonic acid transferase [Xanthobacteraceae bacterium]
MPKRIPHTFTTYRLLATALTPLAGAMLARRLARGKEHPTRILERRGAAGVPRPEGPLVWIHGASVGELVAALPIVERLRAREFPVLVTSGTVTSAALASQRLPENVIHQFAPLDSPVFVRRFLDHWQPDLALFVESDLWPNLIFGTTQRRIPLILLNGRMSERSFARWRRLPKTIETLLEQFDLCLVRAPEDAERFGALGAPRIQTTGNLKLDVPPLPADLKALTALRVAIAGRQIIVAASTHPDEESAIFEAHRRLRLDYPRLLTIVAPRHPERGAEVAALAAAQNLEAVQRSQGVLPNAATEIYVCDTLGELGLIYRLASVVFMGGSLIPHGGQNPIEPIKLGAPVVHGPHVANFADLYEALDKGSGAGAVIDAADLAARLKALLSDNKMRARLAAAGRKTIDALAGAADRSIAAIEPYLVQIRLEARADDA